MAARPHPLLDFRVVLPHPSDHADVLPWRSSDSTRSGAASRARRARAPPAGVALRPRAHHTRVVARLPLRHRRAWPCRDALRGAHMISNDSDLVATASETVGPF